MSSGNSCSRSAVLRVVRLLENNTEPSGWSRKSGGRRVSVVTGGSGGIGRWIALGLARAGQHVVLVCRDRARGGAAVDWIARQVPCPSLELRLTDLGSLRATRRLGMEDR